MIYLKIDEDHMGTWYDIRRYEGRDIGRISYWLGRKVTSLGKKLFIQDEDIDIVCGYGQYIVKSENGDIDIIDEEEFDSGYYKAPDSIQLQHEGFVRARKYIKQDGSLIEHEVFKYDGNNLQEIKKWCDLFVYVMSNGSLCIEGPDYRATCKLGEYIKKEPAGSYVVITEEYLNRYYEPCAPVKKLPSMIWLKDLKNGTVFEGRRYNGQNEAELAEWAGMNPKFMTNGLDFVKNCIPWQINKDYYVLKAVIGDKALVVREDSISRRFKRILEKPQDLPKPVPTSKKKDMMSLALKTQHTKTAKCCQCGKKHVITDVIDKDITPAYTVIYGNIALGGYGEVVGDNFNENGMLANASVYCVDCLIAEICRIKK